MSSLDTRRISPQLSAKRQGHFLVTTLKLHVPSLPPALQDYRLVQLTDFHYGPATSLSHLAEAVEITRALQPHVLLLTGDYVHRDSIGLRHYLATNVSPSLFRWLSYRRDVRELAKSLGALLATIPAPGGVFAICGNHEYLEGVHTIRNHLGEHIQWMTNRTILLGSSDATLQITGIDDFNRGEPDLQLALTRVSGVPTLQPPAVRILLSHNQDITLRQQPELEHFDLMLSGHTHGGQLCLPGGRALTTRTKQRKHVRGLSQHQDTHVYVSSGVGFGLLPLRTFCPPEIVMIELQRAAPR